MLWRQKSLWLRHQSSLLCHHLRRKTRSHCIRCSHQWIIRVLRARLRKICCQSNQKKEKKAKYLIRANEWKYSSNSASNSANLISNLPPPKMPSQFPTSKTKKRTLSPSTSSLTLSMAHLRLIWICKWGMIQLRLNLIIRNQNSQKDLMIHNKEGKMDLTRKC